MVSTSRTAAVPMAAFSLLVGTPLPRRSIRDTVSGQSLKNSFEELVDLVPGRVFHLRDGVVNRRAVDRPEIVVEATLQGYGYPINPSSLPEGVNEAGGVKLTPSNPAPAGGKAFVGQSGRETRGAQGARGTRTSNPPQVNNLVNNRVNNLS